MYRRIAAVAAALVLAVGLGACGDDDDDDEEAADTTVAAAEYEEYCDASLALETAPEPDIDFEEASPAEQQEALKKYANEDLQPLIDDLKETVPAQIRTDADVLFAAFDRLKASGDFDEFEKPDVKAAENRVHAFDIANCGWTKVDVNAVDYAFEGVPPTLEAGVTSFDMRNTGKEIHEMVIVKRKAGVTESFDELLQKEQEETQEAIEPVAGEFATQGQSTYAVAELSAGDYLMVCFIPVGSTSEESEAEGPPHFVRGMKTEFKVS